jgi:enolase-phosphatase E1
MPIRAVLTDIEGTTSSIHFVHQVLFPYSTRELPEFIRRHGAMAKVAPWLNAVANECGHAQADLVAISQTLLRWIAEDRKHTALKALQGLIWADGYKSGAFKGHIYPEVAQCLRTWASSTLLYVYSSGSIAAQKLLFEYSEAGDLSGLFQGYFDTTSGAKRDVVAYQNIARAIGVLPGEVRFLSDIEAELDAARSAGMRTTLLAREALPPQSAHPIARSFAEITL